MERTFVWKYVVVLALAWTTPRAGDDRMQDHKSTDRNLQDAGSARRVSWVNGPRVGERVRTVNNRVYRA